jgi:hypothetical protein
MTEISSSSLKREESCVYFPPPSFSPRYGDEFFTLKFVGFRLEKNAEDTCMMFVPWLDCIIPQEHALYEIEVRRGNRMPWRVFRRFSAILELGEQVLADPQIDPKAKEGIVTPSKTILPRIDDEFLEQRSVELGEYLDRLCLIASRAEHGVVSTCVNHFLELASS